MSLRCRVNRFPPAKGASYVLVLRSLCAYALKILGVCLWSASIVVFCSLNIAHSFLIHIYIFLFICHMSFIFEDVVVRLLS